MPVGGRVLGTDFHDLFEYGYVVVVCDGGYGFTVLAFLSMVSGYSGDGNLWD
jgi:hypothetical protein